MFLKSVISVSVPKNRRIGAYLRLLWIALFGAAGTLERLWAGLGEGTADAALAASIFHFGLHTIAEAKTYLRERGVPVRVEP